jgi:hypothetical protein
MSKHNSEELRRRAKEILADAGKVQDRESHAILVRLAASYIQMAQQVEEMAGPRLGRWDRQPMQQPQAQDQRAKSGVQSRARWKTGRSRCSTS